MLLSVLKPVESFMKFVLKHDLHINKYTYDQICFIPKLKGFLAVGLFFSFVSQLSNINYLPIYLSTILMFVSFLQYIFYLHLFIYLFIYLSI